MNSPIKTCACPTSLEDNSPASLSLSQPVSALGAKSMHFLDSGLLRLTYLKSKRNPLKIKK